jgi:NAD(P) transhydrogenase subunit beta
MNALSNLAYIVASVLFIVGLKMLGRASTARRGNLLSAVGMLIAVLTVLLSSGSLNWVWVLAGLVVGGAIGVLAAQRVQMTQMPEMVALFNGSGGLASLLVGWAAFHATRGSLDTFGGIMIGLAVLIGGVTFSGSLVAFWKLSGRLGGRPIMFRQQRLANALLLAGIALLLVLFVVLPPTSAYTVLLFLILAAFVFGVLGVIPIGGADMPIVVALLNSYSGLAASAAGFAIGNTVLIVAGSLVGASGLVLTQIMCKAMNRSLMNVLLGGFGAATSSTGTVEGEVNPITPEEAYFILEAAGKVVFVPGYGMAVAQAQHAVRELADLLAADGTEVSYAIHPVAGRMPGHMNVLLAEANVPYEQLVEPEDVNPTMDTVDVAMVIGANDVVNPAAREDEGSPLFGMPIINVDQAKTVFVLKRSMNPGFSGVDNPLFFKDNSRMLFGDAKATLGALISEFKDAVSQAA